MRISSGTSLSPSGIRRTPKTVALPRRRVSRLSAENHGEPSRFLLGHRIEWLTAVAVGIVPHDIDEDRQERADDRGALLEFAATQDNQLPNDNDGPGDECGPPTKANSDRQAVTVC